MGRADELDTLGSWELPEELVALRETVRRFMATEVKPVEDRLPHDTYLPPPEILRPLQQKAPQGTTITDAKLVEAVGKQPRYCRVEGHTATPGNAGINLNSGMGGTPITGTIISGNTITNEDVDVVINTPADVDLHLNNLLGGQIGVANLGSGTVDATKNYWGCFFGPGTRGCSTISGPEVTYRPFLPISFF